MDITDEDFEHSDSWLSGQLFSQFKDFNYDSDQLITESIDRPLPRTETVNSVKKTRSRTVSCDIVSPDGGQTDMFDLTYSSSITKKLPSGTVLNDITNTPFTNLVDMMGVQSQFPDLMDMMESALPTFADMEKEMLATSMPIYSEMTPASAPVYDENNVMTTTDTMQQNVDDTMESDDSIDYNDDSFDPMQMLTFKPRPQNAMQTPINEIDEVIGEAIQQAPVPFNVSEEKEKLMQFLEPESLPMQGSYVAPDSEMNIPSSGPIVQCAHCKSLFEIDAFQAHVCDYDENHNLIVTEPQTADDAADTVAETTSTTGSEKLEDAKKKPLTPREPACIRLLRENQIRIRRFLKEELKYDVYANSTPGNTSNSSKLNNGNPNGNSNSGKKPNGPHECTLCERKFVHASGLLRHMEKHALDLIPVASQQTIANTAVEANTTKSNGKQMKRSKQMIKCIICGRLFFDARTIMHHLISHFTDAEEELQPEQIPFDAYIDLAFKFLEAESKMDDVECELPVLIPALVPLTVRVTKVVVKTTKKAPVLPPCDVWPLFYKIYSISNVMQCEFCDYIFADVSNLLVHSATHQPAKRFECSSCEIVMRSSKECTTHWQAECVFMRENTKLYDKRTNRFFVCNVCENKFQSLDLLHEHRYASCHFFPRINKQIGYIQLPCEFCEAVHVSIKDCVKHFEDKHVKKNKRDKESGVASTKTRQYLCDICGKSYTQSSHLWQHLRFHKGVKPFACTEAGCSRKFTIRPDLNDHIRKCHTGERPYHCLVCGKRFLTGSVFYQHRLIHRGERRYECEDCGKRFYRADALKNHQRIHTGEKPFGCLFCTKNFRQRGDRDKHIRARHSHLDANARLMMQMQKLQLEASAAAAAAQYAQQQQQQKNLEQFVSINSANGDEKKTKSKRSLPILDLESDVPMEDDGGSLANEGEENSDESMHEDINTNNAIAFDATSINNGNAMDIYEHDSNGNVRIGDAAFPKSMFELLIDDIDNE